MDLNKFQEFSPKRTREDKPKGESTNLFVTMKDSALYFSRAVTAALNNAANVKILINEEDKQFLLMPSEEGQRYLKPGRPDTVPIIWTTKDLVKRIKEMLPEGQKENVRILGTVVEEGFLFDCNNIKPMRGRG